MINRLETGIEKRKQPAGEMFPMGKKFVSKKINLKIV